MRLTKNSLKKFSQSTTKLSVPIIVILVTMLMWSSLVSININQSTRSDEINTSVHQSSAAEPPTSDQVYTPEHNGVMDSDKDGLSDEDEFLHNTDPTRPDTDSDGLLDGDEVFIYNTIPTLVDSDFDFLCDSQEIFLTKTNPVNPDCDNDGLLDGFEIITFKCNPFDPDTDDDGLNDYQEAKIYHTCVTKSDSDGDGLEDGEEILIYNSNPMNQDTDGDKLSDYWEVLNGFNPAVKDNWFRIVGFGVFIPGFSIIVVIFSLLASVRARSVQIPQYQTIYEKELAAEVNARELYNLLSSLPANSQLTVEEVAKLVNYPPEIVRDLILGLFDESNGDMIPDELEVEDFIINTQVEGKMEIITCFYCGTKFKMELLQCPVCLEEIVRCKLCNKPLGYDDTYTTCASYGVIGEETGINGFVYVDHICESCMLNNKYNII